jgi:hypothetical protein
MENVEFPQFFEKNVCLISSLMENVEFPQFFEKNVCLNSSLMENVEFPQFFENNAWLMTSVTENVDLEVTFLLSGAQSIKEPISHFRHPPPNSEVPKVS